MDRLGTCMDALRVLARSNDPDRLVLVERHIDAYLTTETVSVWQALERLRKAIRDEQAEGREGRELEHNERVHSLRPSWTGLGSRATGSPWPVSKRVNSSKAKC
jgi:hypothetical protein